MIELQSIHQKEFQRKWEGQDGIYILGDLDSVMKIIK